MKVCTYTVYSRQNTTRALAVDAHAHAHTGLPHSLLCQLLLRQN